MAVDKESYVIIMTKSYQTITHLLVRIHNPLYSYYNKHYIKRHVWYTLTEEVHRFENAVYVEVSFAGYLLKQAVDAFLVGCAHTSVVQFTEIIMYFYQYLFSLQSRVVSSHQRYCYEQIIFFFFLFF